MEMKQPEQSVVLDLVDATENAKGATVKLLAGADPVRLSVGRFGDERRDASRLVKRAIDWARSDEQLI